MLPRIIAILSLASLCALGAMLTLTTPTSAGPLGLLVIFICAYLTFVGVISFFLFGMNKLIVAITAGMAVRKPLSPMPFRRAYYYSTVLATAPVMLIGLQSVKPITIYELFLVVAFEVVACVYVSRRIR